MSPWRRLEHPRLLELDAGEAEHLGRLVDADRIGRAGREQFDHPAGAGADVDQAPKRPLAKRPVDRLLDIAFGDMERANLVPDAGMDAEIAGGGLGAVGAHGLEPGRVGAEQVVGALIGPLVDQREHRRDLVLVTERQKNPASFLAPLEDAGVGEDLEVARDPRLALAEDLRQFAHRQFHQPQKRDDPQPGRIGECLEAVGEGKGRGHQIRI